MLIHKMHQEPVINIPRISFVLLLIFAGNRACLATETVINPDLPALIECRQDYRALGALMPLLIDPLAAVGQGWRPLPQTNIFMREYQLLAPINVFGYSTEYIAFAGTAIMAVIDLPHPRVLAEELALETAIDTAEKALFGREVFSREGIDPSSGQNVIESAVLNVSNVSTHPGKTLAGCEYSLDFDDNLDEIENPGEKPSVLIMD